jgi:CYTH domain-containing protein
MPVEIERKFLVKNKDYKDLAKGILYKQGYLSIDKQRTIRVRIIDKKAYLTIKGKSNGIENIEYEYEIDFNEGKEILEKLCLKPLIEKYRYKITFKNKIWEVDEFKGLNDGLIIAEIELSNSDEYFEKPEWLGKEVSLDFRYKNSNLMKNPYTKW